MTHLTDERLREIGAGCEGVTPGPWRAEIGEEAARGILAPQKPDGSSMVIADVYSWPEVVADNAAHIARLDPDTVKALVSELLQLRKENEVMRNERDEALAVAVKPLEWVRGTAESVYGKNSYEARPAVGGSYVVQQLPSGRGWIFRGQPFLTENKAKAAAQADYETRRRTTLASIKENSK